MTRFLKAVLVVSVLNFSQLASAGVTFSSSNLTDVQKEKVRSAIGMVNVRVWRDKVVQCVINNSRKTMWNGDARPHVYPNQSAAEQGIGMILLGIQAYGLTQGDLNYGIYVIGQHFSSGTNGSGQLSITKKAEQEPDGKSRYVITINTATLNNRTVAGVAGTIFHEMLHNIGISHPSTGNYDNDYKKHIIKEYGLCIAGDGVQSMGLTADNYTYNDE